MTRIPTRLLILQRLTAHLESMSIADGYTWDMADRVERGRLLFGADSTAADKTPMLAIIEAPRPDIPSYADEWAQVSRDSWTLHIQGVIKDDRRHPTDSAYYLVSEVQQHLARLVATRPATGAPLYKTEHLLGGLISHLEMQPPVVRPPETGVSSLAFFYLPVRVGVAMDLLDPYKVV